MAFELTPSDERKLVGLHPDLVALVRLMVRRSEAHFMIVEGLRTKERQRELIAAKKSKTFNSKHLTGRAVDIAPLVWGIRKSPPYEMYSTVSWEWSLFTPLVKCAKECAAELGLRVVFGYDWGWDAPHMELA